MNTQRYISYAVAVQGAAGFESFVELWNPATSGRIVKVTGLTIDTKDTLVNMQYHTAEQGAAGVAGTKGNLNLGGVGSVCNLWGMALATVAGTVIGALQATADVDLIVCFENNPIIVKPGQSFILACVNAIKAISHLSMCWHEIDATY